MENYIFLLAKIKFVFMGNLENYISILAKEEDCVYFIRETCKVYSYICNGECLCIREIWNKTIFLY